MSGVKIFTDDQRRRDFWAKIESLIEEYPEIMTMLDRSCEDDYDDRDRRYDKGSPKFIQGLVLVISVRNLDHWEGLGCLDPPEQSAYLTDGMLQKSLEL